MGVKTPPTPAQMLEREQKRARREALELTLLHQLRALGLDAGMVRQHQFHATRGWLLDFAWPGQLLAMEVDGGTWIGGAHSRGAGQERDCEKLAAAVVLGYRVMRATTNQVKSGAAAGWLEQVLRKGEQPRA